MKKFITLMALCLMATSGLVACRTTVQDGPRKVIVEDQDGNHQGHGDFCPPGHAKKGWC